MTKVINWCLVLMISIFVVGIPWAFAQGTDNFAEWWQVFSNDTQMFTLWLGCVASVIIFLWLLHIGSHGKEEDKPFAYEDRRETIIGQSQRGYPISMRRTRH